MPTPTKGGVHVNRRTDRGVEGVVLHYPMLVCVRKPNNFFCDGQERPRGLGRRRPNRSPVKFPGSRRQTPDQIPSWPGVRILWEGKSSPPWAK